MKHKTQAFTSYQEYRLGGIVEEFTRACEDGLKFLDSLPEDYQTAENAAAYRRVLEQVLAKVEGDLT